MKPRTIAIIVAAVLLAFTERGRNFAGSVYLAIERDLLS